MELLRKKGMATAGKKAGRVTAEGAVGSYIHMGGKVGVLVEVNCESDFVARGEEFQQLVKDVAMHIAATDPRYASRAEVAASDLDKEREILMEQLKNDPKNAGKPEEVLGKIIEGRLNKFYEENVLIDQPFVKDPSKTVGELVAEKIGSIKENITIRRFARFKMGEGIEKKADDFAAEVASMVG
jgi:elongation factor Ts